METNMRERSHSIVGVLDLKGGHVVRAAGGRREEYRRWISPLCDSSDPLAIARVFGDRYAIEQLYVADLDALGGGPLQSVAIAALVAEGFSVTLDAGPREARHIAGALELGVRRVVIPLETLPDRAALAAWCGRFDCGRLAFGLDLFGGRLVGRLAADLPHRETGRAALEMTREAAECGLEHVIVLDVAAVGGTAGAPTASLCGEIRREHPATMIWTGGGVRNVDDVDRLVASGADQVLVASALHEGTLKF